MPACAVLQGSNERDAAGGPVVMIRDLVLGAELAKGSKDRSDYLELRQKAQFPRRRGRHGRGRARGPGAARRLKLQDAAVRNTTRLAPA